MRIRKWNYVNCKIEALKYNSKCEFKNNASGAYYTCHKNNWNELFAHMTGGNKEVGYWTYEKCKNEASIYEYKSDYAKSAGWSYRTALKNNWLDDICSHMKTHGNLKNRCVYAYEFDNNHVYIGLTYDFEKRWIKRQIDKKDVVNMYMRKTGLLPNRIQLTDYISDKEASVLENKFICCYKQNNWILLNSVKGGSLGGNIIKWTYDICAEESIKYKTYIEFKQKNINCLSAIYKNNWHNVLLNHLKYTKKKNNYWDKEKCAQCASDCDSKTEFSKKYRGAYAASIKNGWINDFFNLK